MFGRGEQRQEDFAAFVNAASGYLTRTAFLLTGDRDAADDLVQEALVRTYASWWRVRPADARAYARRVLVNLNIDQRRRPAMLVWEAVDATEARDPEGRIDDRDELGRLLAQLAPQQRRVIVLRYFEDLSEAEIAACLGISAGSVKSTCARGLAALRKASVGARFEQRTSVLEELR
mgnify:CR=1 FL=1